MPKIHPTAVVHPEAEIADDVEIGPLCVVGQGVTIGAGTRLISSVTLEGPTRIGINCMFYPNVVIGFPAQDVKFKPGDETLGVTIGDHGVFREGVSVHAATRPEHPTTLGNRVFMMAQSHVGHDCLVGNNVTFVNGACMGGHSEVGDQVTLGGLSTVHQFVRVGRLCFFSGLTGTSMDVPPFCTIFRRNATRSLNLVGMRRSGIPREEITMARKAFRQAIRPSLPRGEMIEILDSLAVGFPAVQEMADFVRSAERAIVSGPARLAARDSRHRGAAEEDDA